MAGFYGHEHGRHRQFDEDAILSFLDIDTKSSVLDAGCGDGYFSVMLKRKFGSVTGIDIDDSAFSNLKEKGIKTEKADICSFKSAPFDLVFMANVFHGLSTECSEIYNVLNSLASRYVAIIDFKPETAFGPPSSMKIPEAKVIEGFECNGFRFLKDADLGTHYSILFEK